MTSSKPQLKKNSKVPPMPHGDIQPMGEGDYWLVRGHLDADELVAAFAEAGIFRDTDGDELAFDLFGPGAQSADGWEWAGIAQHYLDGKTTRLSWGRRLASLPGDDEFGWYYWPCKQGERGATAYTEVETW